MSTDIVLPETVETESTEPIESTGNPPAPPAPRDGFNWRKWRARIVVVAMIAIAGYAATQLVHTRTTAIAQYDIGQVTLSAQAIPVETRQSGQVSTVLVHAQQHVTAGQTIGTIITVKTSASGRETVKRVDVTAPADGIISADPVTVGAMVSPGNPFAQMYDPAALTLNAAVPVGDLSHLSTGMVATLKSDGLTAPVQARIQRVVPVVAAASTTGAPPTSYNRLQVVLVPEHVQDVAQLVPGVRFTGTVDTSGSSTRSNLNGLHVGS